MSEEISVGVRILLERAKSNPEEIMDDYGKWGQLRDAVYAYKEEGHRRAWVRGLREEEIDMLYEMFCTHARQVFDDYVMKNILEGDEGKEEFPPAYLLAQGKRVGGGGYTWNDPRMLAQNTIQPGSWQNVASQTSNTSIANQSLVARLKQELGIK
jgi:hypothetical protein